MTRRQELDPDDFGPSLPLFELCDQPECVGDEPHDHRHHKPPTGMKFCVAALVDRQIVGVAIAGRPVARMLDDGRTVEITRTATDGTINANSILYGAIWRAAKALGYRRAVTYTQEGESGASLRASGFVVAAELPPREGWDCTRTRWEITR